MPVNTLEITDTGWEIACSFLVDKPVVKLSDYRKIHKI